MTKQKISRPILLAALMAGSASAAAPATQTKPPPATRPSIVLEAEAADQHGTLYATTRPGYSGDGYVTAFDDENDHLVFHAYSDIGGLYEVDIRYSAPAAKGFGLTVNGLDHDDFLPPSGDAFAVHVAGNIELQPGENVITLRKGWGFFDIDRIELIPTQLAPLQKPPAALVNRAASPAARDLMKRLVDHFGDGTLSAVQGHADADNVFRRVGVRPAIMGQDLIDYTPSRVEHGTHPQGTTEQLIKDAAAGYSLAVMWHWNAPSGLIDQKNYQIGGNTIDASWYLGFYTKATTFDLAAALADPAGKDYALLLRDIDAIAVELKKLNDAGLPVIWRPLHEADGGWFWWGAKGPDAFKQLWSILYHRLTDHHHLNNLIWVYTGSAKWDWYPPENQFDIIGVDAYPPDVRDPLSGTWQAIQSHYGGRKLLALSEFGGVPDIDGMHRVGVDFAYFMSWVDKLGPAKMSDEELKRIYLSPRMINRSTSKGGS